MAVGLPIGQKTSAYGDRPKEKERPEKSEKYMNEEP